MNRFCVTCGQLLTNEKETPASAHGLLCQGCFEKNEQAGTRHYQRPISVQYCWQCGKSLMPVGAEIKHTPCPLPA